ncbi:MAG: response regulator [Acidobacteriota bacterium]
MPERGRLLVIDDNPDDVKLVREVIREAGLDVDVDTAEDGLDALALLESGSPLPDVVLTDLQMPRMNGLEFVTQMRRLHPSIPVVLMTAYGSEELAFQSLQQGAAGYVPKASMNKGLGGTLEKMLEVSCLDRQDRRLFQYVAQTRTEYRIPSEISLISPLIAHLTLPYARIMHADENQCRVIGHSCG